MATTQQELQDRFHQWMQAVQQHDMATLEQIIAPEYTYAATNHGRRSRGEWMATVANYVINSYSLDHFDVCDYGDFAVTVADYAQEATVDGNRRSGTFLVTDSWIKHNGQWQVAARSSIFMTPSA